MPQRRVSGSYYGVADLVPLLISKTLDLPNPFDPCGRDCFYHNHRSKQHLSVAIPPLFGHGVAVVLGHCSIIWFLCLFWSLYDCRNCLLVALMLDAYNPLCPMCPQGLATPLLKTFQIFPHQGFQYLTAY